MIIPPPVIALAVFFSAFFGWLYSVGAFDDLTPGNRAVEPPEIDTDLLLYFEENDFVRDVSDHKQNPENAPVVYTFLGITVGGERVDGTRDVFTDDGSLAVDQEDVTAVVYDGKLEGGEEEIGRNSHLVKALALSQLFAYTNVRATVRREKMRGAGLYCQLQDSDAEEERRRQYERKVAVDELEASDAGCDVVEAVKAQVENQPALPSADEKKGERGEGGGPAGAGRGAGADADVGAGRASWRGYTAPELVGRTVCLSSGHVAVVQQNSTGRRPVQQNSTGRGAVILEEIRQLDHSRAYLHERYGSPHIVGVVGEGADAGHFDNDNLVGHTVALNDGRVGTVEEVISRRPETDPVTDAVLVEIDGALEEVWVSRWEGEPYIEEVFGCDRQKDERAFDAFAKRL